MNILKKISKLILITLIGAFLGAFIFYFSIKKELLSERKTEKNARIFAANYYNNKPLVKAEVGVDFTTAAEKTINSVVHVKNTTKVTTSSFSVFDFFYDDNADENQYERIGIGSGVIVSPDGYIITNNHVIDDATSIEITTNNNKTYNAKVIGIDKSTDIAVLKIEVETDLPYIPFGDSNVTKIGEWVLAVGNPFNLSSTVTAGIISAKSRDLNNLDQKNQSFIQTDAAVNTGNSGGALVNTKGELIGINTAIVSARSGEYIGYSFAVPSNIARKVFEDILEYGNVQKGLLGVRGQSLNSLLAKNLNIKQTEGFYINNIQKGMGAEKAGIQKGDIIIEIDKIKIKKFADLSGYLSSKRPGNKINIKLLRNNKTKNVTVILKKTNSFYFIGMVVKNIPTEKLKKYGIENGVLIIENDNERLKEIANINNGYVIYSINNFLIKKIEDLEKINIRQISNIIFVSPEGEKERIIF